MAVSAAWSRWRARAKIARNERSSGNDQSARSGGLVSRLLVSDAGESWCAGITGSGSFTQHYPRSASHSAATTAHEGQTEASRDITARLFYIVARGNKS